MMGGDQFDSYHWPAWHPGHQYAASDWLNVKKSTFIGFKTFLKQHVTSKQLKYHGALYQLAARSQ